MTGSRTSGACGECGECERWRVFEDMLWNLSMRFASALAEDFDTKIHDAQRTFCECLQLDQSSLWIRSGENPGDLTLAHIYRLADGPALPAKLDAAREFPWCFQKTILEKETVVLRSLSDLPREAARDAEAFRYFGTKSTVVVPLTVGEGLPAGVLSFASRKHERDWREIELRRMQLIAHVLANAISRKEAELSLRSSLDEIRQLRDQLQEENVYLREQVKGNAGFEAIIGESKAILDVLGRVKKVAAVSSAVLLTGETGTGKELVAEAIHEMSPRAKRPLIKVNCAALPPALIENELFGREKGAYTGAMTRQPGRFELAHGSTLFLDEIAELPPDLQAKLLRVLQQGEFERLGGTQTLKVNVRLVVATNTSLPELVRQGRFRQDLFFRLNVFPIEMPSLRERREDIPLLVWHFVQRYSRQLGKTIESIPRANMEQLRRYSWPGNIRELQNLVERALILSEGPVLRIGVPASPGVDGPPGGTLEDVEARHILDTLARTGWRISGEGGAAAQLGLVPTTLHSRMKKLGISRPTRKRESP